MVTLGLNLGTLAAETKLLTYTLHRLLTVEEPLDLARRAGIQFVVQLVSSAVFDEPLISPGFTLIYTRLFFSFF